MRNQLALFLSISFCLFFLAPMAQMEAFEHQGEIGIAAGAAHYFGDLNNQAAINRPKPAAGFFLRKQLGNYIAIRLSGNYAELGYSDVYSKIEFNKRRNLSFNTSILEVTLQGDFNFYRFEPFSDRYFFTPYVTFGVGAFNYDPYAILDVGGVEEAIKLRPLGTETGVPDAYSNVAICIPFGMGLKYNISRNVNAILEVGYRFTMTDYLDDVSSRYPDPSVFSTLPPSPGGGPPYALLLYDRSLATGSPIGLPGRQRGFSAQKDQYIFVQAGLSFSILSYKCRN